MPRRGPKMIGVGKYISVGEFAKMMGWSSIRGKRWLIRHRAAVKKGYRWYTTDLLLRLHFPEAFREAVLGTDQ